MRPRLRLVTQALALVAGCAAPVAPPRDARPDPGTAQAPSPGLPLPDSPEAVRLEPGVNGGAGGRLTPSGLTALLREAEPLPDPGGTDGWAYAPWYRGTFDAAGRAYRFTLFLGGRGVLVGPDGGRRLFAYHTAPTTKPATDPRPVGG